MATTTIDSGSAPRANMTKASTGRDHGGFSASKLVVSLITLMVLGVCGWAINSVRQHEVMLERHNEQIGYLKGSVDDLRSVIKEEFRDIKTELRKRP